MRRVLATIVAVEEQKFWVFLALGYQHAVRAHHIVIMQPARFYSIVSQYLTHGTILFLKNLLNIKCMFWFSLQVLRETFLILIRNERNIINVHT
jgi:hypothetical protein